MSITIENIEKVYFLGIGGIGMSALARFFNLAGKEVSGYDLTKTALTDTLVAEGMDVHYDEDPTRIPDDVDLIIYTPAIPDTHQSWERIRALDVSVMKRAEVLGLISKSYNTVAVAGTHGKTSTSAITAHVLRSAGLDVTAFVGGIVKNFDSNFVFGESDWMVVEADEFDRSFLHLSPNIAILLSIDPDHLDIYGTPEEMCNTYKAFTLQIQEGGTLLVHHDIVSELDLNWRKDLLKRNIQIYSFGVKDGWFRAENVQSNDHKNEFDFYIDKDKVFETSLMMPGEHNVSNACAAMGVATVLDLDELFVAHALSNFQGIKRRFDFVSTEAGNIIIDDYAHHPSEINAAIKAAKGLYKDQKITVVFQPHLYSRTNDLADEFAESLEHADDLILMPIYPARELPMDGVNSEMIIDRMNRDEVPVLDHHEVLTCIEEKKPEVLLILGAGNISLVADELKRKVNK